MLTKQGERQNTKRKSVTQAAMRGMARLLVTGLMAGAFCVCGLFSGLIDGAASPAHAQDAARAPRSVLVQVKQGKKVRRVRPRTRIIVRRPPQPSARLYPSPAPYDPPGPGYTRRCEGGYVEEMRASGLTVVPRRTCWWQRAGS
ncbi:MAG TPA: hypothetical protein VL402_04210 [Xanthobacteraceae bacterium]|nr:hypothetical protein [Xanthobacteraceae bacterium]